MFHINDIINVDIKNTLVFIIPDVGTINSRLDVVAELTQNSNTFFSIQTVISQFPDIDDLMARIVSLPKQETVATAESKINNIIHLKHSIDLVTPLKDALKDGQSSLLKACHAVSC